MVISVLEMPVPPMHTIMCIFGSINILVKASSISRFFIERILFTLKFDFSNKVIAIFRLSCCPVFDRRMHIDNIYWHALSENPNALPLLEKYPGEIHWNYASRNPALLPLFEKNLNNVIWHYLCIYINDMSFLEKHIDKLYDECWRELSKRAVAVPLLEKYPEHIDWIRICWNPGAIHLIEQYPENISWPCLSANRNAMHLLFRLDHERMREDNEAFKEELGAYVFEPGRLMRLSRHFGIDFRNYLQVY